MFKFKPNVLLASSLIALTACGATSITRNDSADQVVNKFTVITTGDILLHERTWAQAKRDGNGSLDFYPQFEPVAKQISQADLALCHLETPVANNDQNYSGYPIFNVPPQIIPTIKKLGFDMCSTASNHSLDKGFAGITRTLDQLDEAGIAHTGTARSAQEASQPLVMTIAVGKEQVKVGILSYTYGFNGLVRESDKLWSANLINADQIITDAKLARENGAQVVIAKLHWGTEYSSKADRNQIKLANQLADSGEIDLIDGAHSHTVQPVTKIKNTWVAYSHGNLIAAHREPEGRKSEGLIMRWTFTKSEAGNYLITAEEQIPTLIKDTIPFRVIEVNPALVEGAQSGVSKSRLEAALNNTVSTVNSLGEQIPVGASE